MKNYSTKANHGMILLNGVCMAVIPSLWGTFFNYCRPSKWVCFSFFDTNIWT